MHKRLTLTTQLDGARSEAEKYKRIWEKIKSGIRASEKKNMLQLQGQQANAQIAMNQFKKPSNRRNRNVNDSSVEGSL